MKGILSLADSLARVEVIGCLRQKSSYRLGEARNPLYGVSWLFFRFNLAQSQM